MQIFKTLYVGSISLKRHKYIKADYKRKPIWNQIVSAVSLSVNRIILISSLCDFYGKTLIIELYRKAIKLKIAI